ncbi:iron-sulfur cluster assembly scaffold protein [bacterium]|nr:iron-sulfur cluster assembly scaffold protein [bacterium]
MNNDLYHDQIIKWSKKTDNNKRLENPDCSATVSNPLCGDRVTIEVEIEGDVIKDMSCQIKGCMLCRASGSILAKLAGGMKYSELKNMALDLEQALKSQTDNPESFPETYRMFYPVKKHRSRHSCVLLPFEGVIKSVSGLHGIGDK